MSIREVWYDYRIFYLRPEVPEGYTFSSQIKDLQEHPELWIEECPYTISDNQLRDLYMEDITEPKKIDFNFYLSETYKHIGKVQSNIHIFIKSLIDRADNHDKSKFEEPELTIFAENLGDLAQVEYGTPEYKEMLSKVKVATEHHYSCNRHHPQYHENNINDMTLVDLIEMTSDWKAAIERNKNGDIMKSLEINSEKYGMPPQLYCILKNTIEEYLC